ncbi:MAG: hypothetical protein IRY85_07690 [Micromonosporaceae bacterium]|nr:hypothetical protein [Micromonosporaceae bacterium]
MISAAAKTGTVVRDKCSDRRWFMGTAQDEAATTPGKERSAVARAWTRARPGVILSGRIALMLAVAVAVGVVVIATVASDRGISIAGIRVPDTLVASVGGRDVFVADILIVVAPLVVASGALVIVRQLYLGFRQLKWRRRRQREAAAIEALQIPQDVPRPTTFSGVDTIHRAKSTVLPTVPDYQGQMFLRGLTVAVLPPMAVLLAAVPDFAPNDARLALGTALAEIAVLVTALIIVQRSTKPAEPWIAARIRTELLRREEYLRLALVGPYLGRVDDADLIQRRVTTDLDPPDEPSRARAIAMRDGPDGPRWIDHLWTQPHQPVPDLRQRMRSYLHYRIRKQIVWFELGTDNADTSDRVISRFIKSSLVVGVVVVAVQVLLRHVWSADTTPADQLATLLALVLPTVATFLLALRELYAYRGLAASYHHMIDGLKNEQHAVERLITRLDQANADEAAISREFQAAVLHTEALLTHELERWVMIIDRDQFDLDT